MTTIACRGFGRVWNLCSSGELKPVDIATSFVLLIWLWLFLPLIVSLFGRDSRWKGLALALCIAAMLSSPSSDFLANVFWLGAWACAILSIVPWFRPRADGSS